MTRYNSPRTFLQINRFREIKSTLSRFNLPINLLIALLHEVGLYNIQLVSYTPFTLLHPPHLQRLDTRASRPLYSAIVNLGRHNELRSIVVFMFLVIQAIQATQATQATQAPAARLPM